jgi:hypothetical protein
LAATALGATTSPAASTRQSRLIDGVTLMEKVRDNARRAAVLRCDHDLLLACE